MEQSSEETLDKTQETSFDCHSIFIKVEAVSSEEDDHESIAEFSPGQDQASRSQDTKNDELSYNNSIFIKQEVSVKEESETDLVEIEIFCPKSNDKETNDIQKSKRTFDCDSCGKKFTHLSKLRKHAKRNSLNDQTYCIRTSKLLHDNHMKITTGNKPYVCLICERQFIEKSKLVRHLRLHTGEKPFDCSLCKKPFFHKYQLDNHMKIHTGEKPHACTVCDKQYTEKSVLVKHMKIHSGERPYSCSICDKGFIENSDMVKHMRTHTGEKPYECLECKKQFTRKDVLENHKKLHIDKKPYKCSVCNKIFKRKNHFENHKKIHKEENPPEISQFAITRSSRISKKKNSKIV